MKHKYIFVVGGVMSSVGKGVAAASIGTILQSKGLSVTAMKADPYINVDAGTMNPTEHGEVFVTCDGDETDQDIGNYERFLNQNMTRDNYMTTGRVYQSVINRERNLEYDGRCVEAIPHVSQEIIDRIKNAAKKFGWAVDVEVIDNYARDWPNQHEYLITYKKSLKESLNEKFQEESDPIRDMKIGMNFPEGFEPMFILKKQYPGMDFLPIGTFFGKEEGWTSLGAFKDRRIIHDPNWILRDYFTPWIGEFFEKI